MRSPLRRWRTAVLAAAALCTAALSEPATAADHADAPFSKTDPSADITDVFVFRAAGKLVGVICFGGTPVPNTRVDGPEGRFDDQTLFTYHIDTDRDARPDIDINIRFGRNDAGNWGVELENLPGAKTHFVSGPVETVNTADGGLKFYAGLRDDPFFFDFVGFKATEASFAAPGVSGQLLFDSTRDSFAERNITAIAFEMDQAKATNGSGEIYVWATSARLMPGAAP